MSTSAIPRPAPGRAQSLARCESLKVRYQTFWAQPLPVRTTQRAGARPAHGRIPLSSVSSERRSSSTTALLQAAAPQTGQMNSRLNARSWGASKCAIRHLGPTMTVSEVVPFTLVFFFAREISFWRKIHAGAHTSSSLFLYLSSIPFHSHNALNLLSSATDKVNRGGRPPTRRKPAPFLDSLIESSPEIDCLFGSILTCITASTRYI